jgi:riboflavin transporter FmnP
MAAQATGRARESHAALRDRADHARRRLAQMSLWFPLAGSVVILIRPALAFLMNGDAAAPGELISAVVQLWGLYGPYLVAITAYLWAQQKVATGAEKAPNGWQMSVLAHTFTMQIIIVVYVVPLFIYAIIWPIETANKAMALYQSAVHTFTAAAITYFFARPEQDAVAKAKG